jgi:hypothetical protein
MFAGIQSPASTFFTFNNNIVEKELVKFKKLQKLPQTDSQKPQIISFTKTFLVVDFNTKHITSTQRKLFSPSEDGK